MAELGWYIHAHLINYKKYQITQRTSNTNSFSSVYQQHQNMLNEKKKEMWKNTLDPNDVNNYIQLVKEARKEFSEIYNGVTKFDAEKAQQLKNNLDEEIRNSFKNFNSAGLVIDDNWKVSSSQPLQSERDTLIKILSNNKQIKDIADLVNELNKDLQNFPLLEQHLKNNGQIIPRLYKKLESDKELLKKTGGANEAELKRIFNEMIKTNKNFLQRQGFEYLIQSGALISIQGSLNSTKNDILNYCHENMNSLQWDKNSNLTGTITKFDYDMSNQMKKALLEISQMESNNFYGMTLNNSNLIQNLTGDTDVKMDGSFFYKGIGDEIFKNIGISAKNIEINSSRNTSQIDVQNKSPFSRILVSNYLTNGNYSWSNHILNIFGTDDETGGKETLAAAAKKSLKKTAVYYALLGYAKGYSPNYILINDAASGDIFCLTVYELLEEYDSGNQQHLKTSFSNFPNSFFHNDFYNLNSYQRAARLLALFRAYTFTVRVRVKKNML